MPTISVITFDVQLQRNGNSLSVVVHDLSLYPNGAKGIYTITEPDGYVRQGDFTTPDIVSNYDGTTDFYLIFDNLRLSSTNEIQCGTYTFNLQIKTTDNVITSFTRTAVVSFKRPKHSLREEFDVFTPDLKYYDDTNYQASNYNIVSTSRNWIATSSAFGGTIEPTTSVLDLAYSGDYYDATYNISLDTNMEYQHQVYAWLSITDVVSTSLTTYAETPPTLTEIVQQISALRTLQESLQNSCRPYEKVKADFEYAQDLFVHILDKIKWNDMPSIYVDLKELIYVLHNNHIPTYTALNAPIDPYVFDGGAGSIWGTIVGTITLQTDLVNYITSRINSSLASYNLNDINDVTITSVSNNQVLSYNSSTGVWENKSIAIINTGVVNRVPYYTTTTTLGSSADLYFDPATKRLGVGTSNPLAGLDVGTGRITGGSFSGTYRNYLDISGTNSFPAVDFVMPNGGLFRVGEVGVAGTRDIFFQAWPGTTSGYAYLEGWTSAGMIVGTGKAGGTTAPVIFKPNRTERARITTDGELLVGLTAGAGYKIDVSGTGRFSGNLTASAFIKDGGTSSQILVADGTVITAGTNITISGGVISSTGGSGGGSSTLAGLTDVALSTLVGGQYLTYNSGTGKWVNTTSSGGGTGDMTKAVYDIDNDGIVDKAETMTTKVKNQTGGTVYRGTIVYLNGSTGNLPTIAKAQANAESTSAGTFGAVVDDIANNGEGYVCTIGTLTNLDTRSSATNPFTNDTLVDGDTIYLDPSNAGYITRTKPSAPNHIVYIGKVIRTHPTLGAIVYRIQNGYELSEIHDVSITSPANNDILVYETGTSDLWKNKSIATILGYTPQAAITLTTIGTSGLATFAGNTLNIPNYTLSGLGGIALASLSAASPLSYNSSTGVFSIQVANTTQNGYLSSTDWNTFNGKQNAISLTTTGNSGAATFVSNTLNIPNYTLSGLGGVSGTGAANQITYWSTTSGVTGSTTLTYAPTASLFVNNSVTASGAIARGVNFTPTLIAAANNDVLVGLDIAPAFTNGAFTNVRNLAIRVTNGDVRLAGNLQIDGNFTVGGTTTTVNAQTLSVADNMIYLNNGSTATITNVSGNGTTVTYTAANNYVAGMTVTITGVNPTAYNLTAVTIASASSTQFTVTNSATGAYVSGGSALAKTNVDPDIGFAGAYNNGTYAHTGLFRDASDSGIFKFFKGYTPEPDASVFIDTTHASFALATVQAATFIGALQGNADTVTNGVYTTGSYANPAWVASLAWTKITGAPSFITLTGLSATAPLSYNNTTGAFTISQATTTTNGYLSSTDWNTFNGKQSAITLTTTGSSGAATFVTNTLNIPTYTLAGLGGISLTSLSATTPIVYNNTTGVFSMILASTSTSGYLSSTDWNTFNNKQAALTGTSSQLAAGNGSAVTVGSGLTLSAGTLTASGGSSTITFNRVTIGSGATGSDYPLVLTDASKIVEMNVDSAFFPTNTVTVPLNSSVAFPIGTQITITQYGLSITSINPATVGVVIRSSTNTYTINAQFSAVTLVKVGTDEWYLYGGLAQGNAIQTIYAQQARTLTNNTAWSFPTTAATAIGTTITSGAIDTLILPVAAGKFYSFRFVIHYGVASATATGAKFSIVGVTATSAANAVTTSALPMIAANANAPTRMVYQSSYDSGTAPATTKLQNYSLATFALPAANLPTTTPTVSSNICIIEGVISPAASGYIYPIGLRGGTGASYNVNVGSYVQYQILN